MICDACLIFFVRTVEKKIGDVLCLNMKGAGAQLHLYFSDTTRRCFTDQNSLFVLVLVLMELLTLDPDNYLGEKSNSSSTLILEGMSSLPSCETSKKQKDTVTFTFCQNKVEQAK